MSFDFTSRIGLSESYGLFSVFSKRFVGEDTGA